MEDWGESDTGSNCVFENEVSNNMSYDDDEFECYEKDVRAIEYAVKVLLIGLGEDIDREGIKKTPLRVAKALCEGTKGYTQSVNDIMKGALFSETSLEGTEVDHVGEVSGFVIVRDLEFYSYCEYCMLPFYFKCHVGYVPSRQRVMGLSKLSRVVNVFAKRFQEPQRLADEICSTLHKGIQPTGVAVVLQCTHINFPDTDPYTLDSDHKALVEILVSSGSGVFENKDADAWGDVFGLLKFRGIDKNKVDINKHLCPSLSCLTREINPIMVSAVSSILQTLGEDPTRKELRGTPRRFLNWMVKFHCCSNIDKKLKLKLNGFPCNDEKVNYDDKKVHSKLNLPFWSQCEHHLLPFCGFVHIGYFISKGYHPIPKSLLQSIVLFYGFKFQVQERLTKQIAQTISTLVGGNVIVVVEASHTCMISRGIEKFGSNTATIAVLGRFSTDHAEKNKFLKNIHS